MAFWNDAMQKMQNMLQQKQPTEKQPIISNRENGGFSGYQPRVGKRDAGQTSAQQVMGNTGSIADMMPGGVDASQFGAFRTIGGQPQQIPQQMPPQMGQPPMQQMPPQGMPQQPLQQQMTGQQSRRMFFKGDRAQQPQQPLFNPQQPVAQGPVQPYFQQNQPPVGQAIPPMQPAMPQQSAMGQSPFAGTMNQPPVPQGMPGSNINVFPGTVMADDGAYKLVFRVAQITGVTSCFRVIEFMYNNEAVIVNAEMITDLVEADRCMDLIFGAACAFRQRLIRVSGKQIYLITPPQVRVESYDNMLRAGMEDIDRRWPGARQMNMQNHAQSVQQPQQPARGFMGRSQQQGDFVSGMGRRANRGVQGDYTDYGGFSMKR